MKSNLVQYFFSACRRGLKAIAGSERWQKVTLESARRGRIELFQATRYMLQRSPLVDIKEEPISGGLLLGDILSKLAQKIRKKYGLANDAVREECHDL